MSRACPVLWESGLIRLARFGDSFLRNRYDIGSLGWLRILDNCSFIT